MNVRFPFLFSTILTATAVGLTACGGGGSDDSPGGGNNTKVSATGLYKDGRNNRYIVAEGEGKLTIASCEKAVLGGTKYFSVSGNDFEESSASSGVTSYSGRLIRGTSTVTINLYQGTLADNASADKDFATLTPATSSDALTVSSPSLLANPEKVCFDVSSAEDVGVDTIHMLMVKDGELVEMETNFDAGISIRGFVGVGGESDEVNGVLASDLLSGVSGITDANTDTSVIETELGISAVNINSCTAGGKVSGNFTFLLTDAVNFSGTFSVASSPDTLTCATAGAIPDSMASELVPLTFLNSDNCDSAAQNGADIDGLWRLNPVARETMEFALNQLVDGSGVETAQIQDMLDRYIEPLLEAHYLMVQAPAQGDETVPSVRMAMCEPIDAAEGTNDVALWMRMDRINNGRVGVDSATVQDLDENSLTFQLPGFDVESSKKISFTLEDLLTSNPDFDAEVSGITGLGSISLVFNKDDATKNDSCINTNAVADGQSEYSRSNLTCVGLINGDGQNTLSIFSRVENQPAFLTFNFSEKVDRTNRTYNMGDGVLVDGKIFFPEVSNDVIEFTNAKIRFIRDYDQYTFGQYLDENLNYKIHGHYIVEIPDGDGSRLIEGNFFSTRYK